MFRFRADSQGSLGFEQFLRMAERSAQNDPGSAMVEVLRSRSVPGIDLNRILSSSQLNPVNRTENLLRFNPQLYQENREDFLRQTVPHEVAHLVAHQLFGLRIQPHGEEWQLIMRGVYELPPSRCHTYAVKRRQVARFIYRCSCPDGEFPFSAQRHALVAKGRRYLCRRCRATLNFSGEQRSE